MSQGTILIIDDEKAQRTVLAGFLRKKGFDIALAASAKEGISIFESQSIDLIMTDYRMPGGTGLDVLHAVKRINPGVPLILITAYGSIEGAVEAMRDGAFDYISKPVKLNALAEVVERALEQRLVYLENQQIVDQADGTIHLDGLIAESSVMQAALNVSARAAQSDATVLVLGETGTGKEVIARAIHRASKRAKEIFLAVNCGALAEGLLESELFGHEKGAFTDASARRIGRFEEADGGTLFLDEVGDLSPGLQIKMLRVLQEGEFQRVGSNQTLRTDVRVIAATLRDLDLMVRDGSFREDLYYRLNVITVRIPPLRSRREDISALAEGFLKFYMQKNKKEIKGFSKEAMDVLLRHHYPGNVRELENAIERAVVMARGDVLSVNDLPEVMMGDEKKGRRTMPVGSLPDRLEAMEQEAIMEAMKKADGVQSQAARLLGINERNLRYKLSKYRLKE